MNPKPKVLLTAPKSLYAAFDLFPSFKGAAIHIDKFSRALFDETNGGLLYVLGNETMTSQHTEGNVETVKFTIPTANYLERAVAFGQYLSGLLDEAEDNTKICHFRDIWSGSAILRDSPKYKTVFEVNGFPSVELPFTYRQISADTLEKIRQSEKFCLEKADIIITPSNSIKEKVLSCGIKESKIAVIPNGANIPLKTPRPENVPLRYIIYFGALQPWQGLETLFKAFARLADLEDLYLVICASNYSRRVKFLKKLAEKLEIDKRIVWNFALPEKELAPWREHAVLSVAPLTECSRNIEQGCAPLKILESMASGVPVVASDLPSVREIMTDGEHGRLFTPENFGELARIIRVLLQYPDFLRETGEKARRRIETDFLWDISVEKLKNVYRQILN